MQISIRSQLIAGTAAVVGASAIAMTPVTQANLALPDLQMPSVAQVALAGFDSPISELIASLGLANNYILNNDDSIASFPGVNPVVYAGVLPLLGFNAAGLVPQIINDHLPIISQLGINGSDNLFYTGKGLGTSALLLSEGVWNAAGDVLSLDIPGAINTLVDAAMAAGTVALATGNYVVQGMLTRLTAVAAAIPALLETAGKVTLGQATVLVGATVEIATSVVSALGSLDFEGAWNAAVDGLLGPTGLPGVVTNLTIGPGVSADPMSPVTSFVPSIRGEIQGAVKTIAGALATANPAPPPAAAKLPSASALRTAAAQEVSVADESGASASNGNSGGGNGASAGGNAGGTHSKSGSTKAGAKHGVAGSKRAAAKASVDKSAE